MNARTRYTLSYVTSSGRFSRLFNLLKTGVDDIVRAQTDLGSWNFVTEAQTHEYNDYEVESLRRAERPRNKFPLEDGAKFTNRRGDVETVGGEIKPPHDEPVCWTIQGNWYRRSDGEPMTGAGDGVITLAEFYRRRRQGGYDPK